MFRFERTPQFDLTKYRYVGETPLLENEQNASLWFKPDGTRLFYMGRTSGILRSYDMSTPWDIRTITNQLSSSARLVDTGSVNIAPNGIAFNSNGTVMLVVDEAAGQPLYKYNLSAGWNVTSINTTASQQTYDISVTGANGVWLGNNDNTIAISTNTFNGIKVSSISSSLDLNTITLQHIVSEPTVSTTRPAVGFANNGNIVYSGLTAGLFATVELRPTSSPYGPMSSVESSAVNTMDKRVLRNLVGPNTLGDIWMSNDGNYLYLISRDTLFNARKIYMFSTLYPPFLNL